MVRDTAHNCSEGGFLLSCSVLNTGEEFQLEVQGELSSTLTHFKQKERDRQESRQTPVIGIPYSEPQESSEREARPAVST